MSTAYMDGLPPWLDIRLTKEEMNYLWDIIKSAKRKPASDHLAGNITQSYYIHDTNDWFFNSALQNPSDTLYFRTWENFSNVHVAKMLPPPTFRMDDLWGNRQKQHEFNPPHTHVGVFSFVVFMKIPTHWKEQHSLPIAANSNSPMASDFAFTLGQGKEVMTVPISLSPEDEGRMLFFDADITHQVFPFYGTEEERITISGNIVYDKWPTYEEQMNELKHALEGIQEKMEKVTRSHERRNELKNMK